jgi:YesN/AraC family two-component response regulator
MLIGGGTYMNATESTIEGSDKNLTLLVVDDEEIIRERLKDLGEKLGLDVHTANDGVDGWEAFKEVQPDLAILDIYMPRMNGLLLMHKIKEMQPDCPVILITGFLHYEQLIQKDRIKPEGFIIKPFHMEKIANLILELVEDGVRV